jgi:predicted  nucleic acid-binding Zn-ribbon protein
MAMGEYYMCSYRDYYDLRQQIDGLEVVRRGLEEENRIFSQNNENLSKNIQDLQETMKTQFPGLLEAQRDHLEKLAAAQQEQARLTSDSAALKDLIATETGHLKEIREQISGDVGLLKNVSKILQEQAAQFPDLLNSLASIIPDLYNSGHIETKE